MAEELQKVGGAAAMQRVHRLAARVAPTIVPALNRVAEGAMTGGAQGAVAGAAGEAIAGMGGLLRQHGAQKMLGSGLVSSKALRPGALARPRTLAPAPGTTLFRAGKAVEGAAPIAKLGSFRSQVASFFDELTNMRDGVRKERDEDMERATQRPFPNLLTQDEEPYSEWYRSPLQYMHEEPEIILGRRIG
jgi:hypothetical protein